MHVDKPSEARLELRVLNFSAKFLSVRQAAVSNALGCRAADGDGGLVPTHPGKEQTSSTACGRPAWRPHSQALNKHEIIIRGAATVAAAAATLLFRDKCERQVRTLSARLACLRLSRRPAGGARGPMCSQYTSRDLGAPETQRRRARRWARRTPARERPQSGRLHPLLGPGSDPLGGECLRVQSGAVDPLAPLPRQAPLPCPTNHQSPSLPPAPSAS